MKKYFFLFSFLMFFTTALQAQAVAYPQDSLQAADAVEAPASSIDLLKRSLGASDIMGTADSVAPAQNKKAKSTEAAAPAQVSASEAAVNVSSTAPAVSQPVPQTAPKTASGNVLEMPLSSGNVVKTHVPVTSAPHSTSAQSVSKILKPAAKSKTPAAAAKPAATTAAAPTPTEKEIETHNGLLAGERIGAATANTAPAAGTAADAEETSRQAIAQEELDYAARIIRQAREEATAGRFIPPAASESAHTAPAAPSNRPFNPNDFRPGVEWVPSSSTHFTIYTQKRDNGISSSNMGMTFESAYSTLRRNIPWMMSDKVRVFVYQDHSSYLKHEPNAQAWTRALAYPTRGEIVVYDEPGKQQELKEVFTHELVHIFTQKFFDKYKTGRLMTPAWLDEGLAVYMEDQAYNGTKGGPWGNDFKTLNFQRSKETQVANFSSSNMFGTRSFTSAKQPRGGQPLYFMPFDEFMQEGSLSSMEGRGKAQDWYFQAYTMVRFLLNPAGSLSPSNRMQFEQFTRLMSQGEQVRDPRTGFPARDANGKPVYQPYSAEKALARAYRYNTTANFEDAFWRWADGAR